MGGWTGRDRDRVLWDGIISINGTPNEPKDLVTKEYVDDADDLKVPYTGATTDVDLNGKELVNLGDVGIGTTSPSKELDVVGNANITGSLYVGGINAFLINIGSLTLDDDTITSNTGQIDFGSDDITTEGKATFVDQTLDSSTTFTGINVDYRKTLGNAGTTHDHNAFSSKMYLNDASDSIGKVQGTLSYAGILSLGGTASYVRGGLYFANLDAGIVTNDAQAGYFYVDQEIANTVSGDINGIRVRVDADGTVTGNTSMIYLEENSNVDYGIYQDGTAPSVFGGNIFAVDGTFSGDLNVSGNALINGSVNISGNLEFSDGSASIIGSSAYDAGDITLKTSDSFAGAPGKITLVSSNYDDTIPGGDISIYSESTGVGVGDVLLQEEGGNVGIGTTSPSVDLEIGTSGGAETSLRLNSDDAGNYIQIDSVGNVGRIKLTGSSNFIMSSEGAAGYMSIFTNNAERYRFTKALALGRNYKGTAYYNVPEDGLIVEGDVGIGTTSPDTKLQVVGTTKLGDDNTNYSTFETTGFMEATGTAKAYRDINMAGYLLTRPASSAPDVVSFLDESGTDTTIETYGFDVDEKVHGGFELQHDYAEGTDLVFHVHWQGITAPSGTDNVQWRLNYIVMRDGETLDAAVTIDSPDTPFDTQYETVRSDFTAITGTNFKIGDQFMFTLTRVTATGDAYAGDALIATAGIHYQVNTIGSRTITVK